MGPNLGCVIIGTSEQEIPMDSYERKGEFKYSKEYQKIKAHKSARTYYFQKEGISTFRKTQCSDLYSSRKKGQLQEGLHY